MFWTHCTLESINMLNPTSWRFGSNDWILFDWLIRRFPFHSFSGVSKTNWFYSCMCPSKKTPCFLGPIYPFHTPLPPMGLVFQIPMRFFCPTFSSTIMFHLQKMLPGYSHTGPKKGDETFTTSIFTTHGGIHLNSHPYVRKAPLFVAMRKSRKRFVKQSLMVSWDRLD